ncbi:MAG: hypothetical protein AAGD00_01870 [Planctomycetota bacterium]
MHIVTKFLVVLGAVLSILLSGLAVAYTKNAGDLRNAYEAERSAKDAAIAAKQRSDTEAASLRSSQQAEVSRLNDALSEKTDEVSDLQAQTAALRASLSELQRSTTLHNAQIDQFNATVQTLSDVNASQANELTTLRQRELQSAEREIEFLDRINDLEGQLEVVSETNRALREQVTELRETLDLAQRGSGAGVSGSAITSTTPRVGSAPARFRGRVTSVQTDVAGSQLAEVTGGLSDGLAAGMTLNIVRLPDTFVAKIVLERVDQNESVGRIDYLGREGVTSVQSGDRVLPPLR